MVAAGDELAAGEVVLEHAHAALDPLVVELEHARRRLARHEFVGEVLAGHVGDIPHVPHHVLLLRAHERLVAVGREHLADRRGRGTAVAAELAVELLVRGGEQLALPPAAVVVPLHRARLSGHDV